MDRFRAAPIAGHAVLDGRITADLVRNTIVFVVVAVTGVLLGFRFHGNVAEVSAYLLVVGIGAAFSWVQAYLALVTGDAETMQVVGYIWVFPLAFLSSAFVPTSTMPEWLQASPRISRSRSWSTRSGHNQGGYVAPDTIGPIALIAVILAVRIPLATRRFNRLSCSFRTCGSCSRRIPQSAISSRWSRLRASSSAAATTSGWWRRGPSSGGAATRPRAARGGAGLVARRSRARVPGGGRGPTRGALSLVTHQRLCRRGRQAHDGRPACRFPRSGCPTSSFTSRWSWARCSPRSSPGSRTRRSGCG